MSVPALFTSHHAVPDKPADAEPGALPVEPDEGPVPPAMPADPEHGGSVGPAG